MTLREQISQLFARWGSWGPRSAKELASFMSVHAGRRDFFRRNLRSVQQIVDLTNGLQSCRLRRHLLIAIDQEGTCRGSRLDSRSSPCAQLGRVQFQRTGLFRRGDDRQRDCVRWAST